MILTYSGKSASSANAIADCDDDIMIVRGSRGDINWGRARANTKLNPDISNSTNKRVMRELFREHGVPMPKLYTRGQALKLRMTDDFGDCEHVLVGRPDRHMKGRGYWVCRTEDEVIKAIAGTRRKKAATHFMEYVESDREYRVHIFRGKSIRISEKSFDNGDKRSYTTIKPSHPVKHVRQAAKQAVKALGLDFGAVDILATDDKCWVLEVNAAPGLGGSMPVLYAEQFNKWYKEQ